MSVENIEGLEGPPGWRIHQLTGDRAGTWSISVSGNWRITFEIDSDEIHSLDLGGLPLMSEEIQKVGMKPSHPGEFIREEILAELGLSIARAAEILGVRRATLSDLVNGNAALSPEMALRIEKAFGVNMDMLLRMQAWFDTYTMRQRAGEIDVKPFMAFSKRLYASCRCLSLIILSCAK
jgi:addiction module HigA family antidote